MGETELGAQGNWVESAWDDESLMYGGGMDTEKGGNSGENSKERDLATNQIEEGKVRIQRTAKILGFESLKVGSVSSKSETRQRPSGGGVSDDESVMDLSLRGQYNIPLTAENKGTREAHLDMIHVGVRNGAKGMNELRKKGWEWRAEGGQGAGRRGCLQPTWGFLQARKGAFSSRQM